MGMDCNGGDNGGRNIKRDQVEFIDVGTLNGDSRFNTKACTVKRVLKVCKVS